MLCVVGVLLAAELAVRTVGASLSANDRHIAEIPQIVKTLAESPSPRILFLGNSLTREGVDIDAFQQGFGPASCAKAMPDDTNILDWYYLYLAQVNEPNFRPDVLVVGFARNQLSDDRRPQPRQLAQLCAWRDVPTLALDELPSFGDKCDLLLAKVSRMYARQEAIKHRALLKLVPHYADVQQRLNTSQGEATAPAESTFTRLTRWLELLEETKVRGVFVAMPVGGAYEVDKRIGPLCADHQAFFLDAHEFFTQPGTAWTGDRSPYSDGYHMNAEGARVYSEYLGEKMKAELHPGE